MATDAPGHARLGDSRAHSLASLFGCYSPHELALARSLLRPARLSPPVYVVRTAYHSDLACCLLLDDIRQSIDKQKRDAASWAACRSDTHGLSFDTETTVTRKTHPSAPSVIQLATPRLCVLFQVYAFTRWSETQGQACAGPGQRPLNFPPRLKAILESPHLVKYGVGACMDAQALESSYGIVLRSVLELQQLNDGLGLPKSLAKYTALYSTSPAYQSKTLMRKHVWRDHLKRCWERPELNTEEVDYASKDVFAVISALRHFVRAGQPHLFSVQKELDSLREAEERARAQALDMRP